MGKDIEAPGWSLGHWPLPRDGPALFPPGTPSLLCPAGPLPRTGLRMGCRGGPSPAGQCIPAEQWARGTLRPEAPWEQVCPQGCQCPRHPAPRPPGRVTPVGKTCLSALFFLDTCCEGSGWSPEAHLPQCRRISVLALYSSSARACETFWALCVFCHLGGLTEESGVSQHPAEC